MTPFYVSCIVSQALSNMLGPICSSRPCKKKQKTQSSSVDVLCVGFHFPFANTTLRKRKQPDGAVTNQPYRQKKCEVAPKRTLKDRAKVANHQTRLQYSEMRTMNNHGSTRNFVDHFTARAFGKWRNGFNSVARESIKKQLHVNQTVKSHPGTHV